MAGEPLRREATGIHRREWVSHLHDALEGQSSERREGIWQGPKEPRQEPNADRKRHPRRSDGRLYDD